MRSLDEPGELLDGEIGMRKVEAGRRPHHDAVLRLAAALGERIDIGERDAVERGLLDAEAAEPRSQREPPPRRHCAASHAIVTTSPMREPLAPERSRPLPMNTTVRFGASTSNIESGGETIVSKKRGWSLCTSLPAMMKRSARLRASVSVGHYPAGRLQHFEIAVLRLAQGVIDDAARALGERHHRAHALDVGGKPAIERKLGLADQLGRFLDGLGEVDVLAADLRARRR